MSVIWWLRPQWVTKQRVRQWRAEKAVRPAVIGAFEVWRRATRPDTPSLGHEDIRKFYAWFTLAHAGVLADMPEEERLPSVSKFVRHVLHKEAWVRSKR